VSSFSGAYSEHLGGNLVGRSLPISPSRLMRARAV
jgi:hypothetical protein